MALVKLIVKYQNISRKSKISNDVDGLLITTITRISATNSKYIKIKIVTNYEN